MEKKDFFDWQDNLKKAFPGTIIKYASYCRNECPVMKLCSDKTSMCEYCLGENQCDGIAFIGCKYYALYPQREENARKQLLETALSSNIHLSSTNQQYYIESSPVPQNRKKSSDKSSAQQKKIKNSYSEESHSKNSNYSHSSDSYSSVPKVRTSARYKKFVDSVNQKIQLTNNTGVAINEGRIVMIDGRLVSRELLDD